MHLLKSNQEAVNYPHNICVTIVPMGISCLAAHYYNSQRSQLGKTADNFSPPEASIAPSVLWKLASKEEASQSVPIWFLHVWPKCVVFSSIGSCHQVLVGSQERWQCSVSFEEPLGQPWSTTWGEISHTCHWAFYSWCDIFECVIALSGMPIPLKH